MKKKFIWLVGSVLMVLTLLVAACAPAPEKEAAPAVKEAAPVVKEVAPGGPDVQVDRAIDDAPAVVVAGRPA